MQMLLGPDTAQQSQKENKETACPNQQPIFGFVISQKQSQEERGTDQQTAVEVEESKMSHAVVVVRSTPLNVSVARRRILTCTDHMNKLLSWQRRRPGRQTSTIANPVFTSDQCCEQLSFISEKRGNERWTLQPALI
jgi:hypothetical protein